MSCSRRSSQWLRAAAAAEPRPDDDAESAGGAADLTEAGRLDRVAAHGLELGADQARSVGPAELLAEETELSGAVAVAGSGVLGVGEAATAALLEAEAELDVLGAGHVRVEVADELHDVAAIGGVRRDRVGGIRGEGEPLPVTEEAGGLALRSGGRRKVPEVAADAADLGVLEGAHELGEPLGFDQAVGIHEGEDFARALRDAPVTGVGYAAPRLADVADLLRLDEDGGAVGGGVVDDQDLVEYVGREELGDESPQEVQAVERDHDRGDASVG